MAKRVSELSKEEIAKLFPIELSDYNPDWAELFEKEKKLIQGALGDNALRIEHFGSTAVPGLIAKDTIDILIEIPNDETKHSDIIRRMKSISYDFMMQTDGEPPYMIFIKGYHISGAKEQTYHVHMAPDNHDLWERLLFRDYLKDNPDVAKRYEALKVQLAEKCKYDRVGYRMAKSDFISEVTNSAKQHYAKNKKNA